jgi:hypothetical protein
MTHGPRCPPEATLVSSPFAGRYYHASFRNRVQRGCLEASVNRELKSAILILLIRAIHGAVEADAAKHNELSPADRN